MIEKNEIMDFIEETTAKKVKDLALIMTAMLNDKQLQVLDSRFTKKVDFEPQKLKKSKDDNKQDMKKQKEVEDIPENIPEPPKAPEPDLLIDDKDIDDLDKYNFNE